MQLVLKQFSEGGREKNVNCIKDKEENQFHLMLKSKSFSYIFQKYIVLNATQLLLLILKMLLYNCCFYYCD